MGIGNTLPYYHLNKLKEGDPRYLLTLNQVLINLSRVNYKKIDYNVSIRFPFTIPNGYEEMQLN